MGCVLILMSKNKVDLNISFGKTLVATCQIKSKSNDVQKCNIFELNEKSDCDYFEKELKRDEWENSKYMKAMHQIMNSPFLSKSTRTYSLESQQGDCLGYIATLELNTAKNKENIQYLEVCPSFAFANGERNLKYIGQSLVTFLIAQAQKEGKSKVCVPIYSTSAKDFYYKKCGFEYDEERVDGFAIERKNFDKALDNLKNKTGAEINFVL